MRKKILTLLLLILIPILKVNAYSFSIPWINTSDPGTPSYDPNYDPYSYIKRQNMPEQQDNNYNYYCSYKYYTYHTKHIAIDIFDENGIALNPDRLVPEDLKFTAGTAIKMDINEERRVHWNIDDIKVERQTYRCFKYTYYATACQYNNDGTSLGCSRPNPTPYGSPTKTFDSNSSTTPCTTRDEFSYSSRYDWVDEDKYTIWSYYIHYEAENITEPEPTGNYRNACESKAKEKVESIINSNKAKTSTYEVQYFDGNKINATPTEDNTIKETGDTKEDNKCDQITINSLSSPTGGILHCSFSYNLGKTCMNVLTAKVRYIKSDSSETCKTENGEIEVINKSNNIKTNYFIPLDAKNNDVFKLLIDKNKNYDDPLEKEQCSYVRNHYKDWQNLIVGYDGESRLTDDNFKKKNDGSYEYIGVNNMSNTKVCFLKTSIIFPIEQKFYGQTGNYQSLKGYGMFFRQIDINNPFPNGLTKESYWYGLYNSGKVNGKELTTSFGNESTYVASITNSAADAIRKYNNNAAYTKWVSDNIVRNGMNANGTSDFIRINNDTYSIFEKQVPTNSFYKLGCGPTNKDWSWCKS